MPALVCEAFIDAPCPRVGLTVSGLGIAESTATLWRTADGVRSPVRGARRVSMVEAGFVIDYDAPLGRPITYELEVLRGPGGASRTVSAPVTVESDEAWIMDPLVPQSAIPVRRTLTSKGEPVFMVTAMAAFEYQANVSLFEVMGSDRPMALMGQRAAARGVNLSLITDLPEQQIRVRNLFRQATQILVRVPPSVNDAIEGTCFLAVATVSESSPTAHIGNPLTTWTIQGDTIAAPAVKALTAMFSYGDVQILFNTYAQKQELMAGKTYLDDLKNPIGG
jgi:hypothetical protein